MPPLIGKVSENKGRCPAKRDNLFILEAFTFHIRVGFRPYVYNQVIYIRALWPEPIWLIYILYSHTHTHAHIRLYVP